MTIIKAPFNFVPLSDIVYFPDWGKQISHDAPFKDSVSGTIDLEITAKSPIFVRNGHTKQQAKDGASEYKSFSQVDHKYFIPATSIKGAIRNVLEILSYGKMRLDRNSMFAQRTWDDPILYPLKKEQQKFYCGWLKRTVGNHKYPYVIENCGKPYRIAHTRIDEYLRSVNSEEVLLFKNFFSKHSGFNLNQETLLNEKKFDPKTAAFKYELTRGKVLRGLQFDLDKCYCNEYKANRLKVALNEEMGIISGTIVFTGQPDSWVYPRPITLTKNAGKFYDFVFPDVQYLSEGEDKYYLSDEYFNHFKFIYSDTPDWENAINGMENEGIPVFFRVDNQKVKDFGLAYLYKLPYDKSPFDVLSQNHKSKELDLSECLFGYTNEDGAALRGRVHFTPAFSENAERDDDVTLALRSPKASYYPIYISQSGSNGTTTQYATYNQGKIAGWKRYPVREQVWNLHAENDDNDTVIHPIKKESCFISRVVFHNLKEIELGALLSALTFHNSTDCYHQLGQGKPFGYGKVSIKLSNIRLSSTSAIIDNSIKASSLYEASVDRKIELMFKFEEAISKKVRDWCNSPSVIQLFTMAHNPVMETKSGDFEYMRMDTKTANNEFIQAKSSKEFLQRYSDLYESSFAPSSLEMIHLDILTRRKALGDTITDNEGKILAGLSFLEEKYENKEYKVKDFKGTKNRIDSWIKKAKIDKIPDSEILILHSTLLRLYLSLKEKEKCNWRVYSKSEVWKSVIQWIGEKEASELFRRIVNQQS